MSVKTFTNRKVAILLLLAVAALCVIAQALGSKLAAEDRANEKFDSPDACYGCGGWVFANPEREESGVSDFDFQKVRLLEPEENLPDGYIHLGWTEAQAAIKHQDLIPLSWRQKDKDKRYSIILFKADQVKATGFGNVLQGISWFPSIYYDGKDHWDISRVPNEKHALEKSNFRWAIYPAPQ